MGLFDRFRQTKKAAQSISDPVFGELKGDSSGSWSGSIAFSPAGRTVRVLIHADGSNPAEVHQRAYNDLSRRYAQLRPAIGDALFALWKPWLDQIPDKKRSAVLPHSADQVLAQTQLESIAIEHDGSLVLGYAFATSGVWDDAVLNVGLKDWVPRPVGVDD